MTLPPWLRADLADLLSADLAATPAERAWRRELAPELSYGRHDGPPRGEARLAAVAVVLCWDGREWSLPLTVRTAGLSRHGGQVSLPGGLIDQGESPRMAAGRELHEELGPPPPLQWIGELAPLLVYASNAYVRPCIAVAGGWPEWQPQPAEVAEVLRYPLAALMEPLPAPLVIERGSLAFRAPRLMAGNHSIWGATAAILGELRGRLRRLAQRT